MKVWIITGSSLFIQSYTWLQLASNMVLRRVISRWTFVATNSYDKYNFTATKSPTIKMLCEPGDTLHKIYIVI